MNAFIELHLYDQADEASGIEPRYDTRITVNVRSIQQIYPREAQPAETEDTFDPRTMRSGPRKATRAHTKILVVGGDSFTVRESYEGVVNALNVVGGIPTD